MKKPKIITRAYDDARDFKRIHQLLVDTYPITPPGFNWEIRRWEGSRYYDENPECKPEWAKKIQLWESESGQLVGAVHPDGKSLAVLELHPDYRFLEDEMLAWAEGHLAAPTKDEPTKVGRQQHIHIFVYEYDTPRIRKLEQRGYEKTTVSDVIRRLRFGNMPLPDVNIAEGYILRTIRPDREDAQRLADLLNAAFNRDFHTAQEFFTFSQMAPCFRHDLHLVAEAPDGTLAAHVGVIYDEVNQRGIYEPVCTHPAHRRKNLARTLMFDGLHRLRSLGATDVYVETGGDMIPANRLYESIGFTETYKNYMWRKIL